MSIVEIKQEATAELDPFDQPIDTTELDKLCLEKAISYDFKQKIIDLFYNAQLQGFETGYRRAMKLMR